MKFINTAGVEAESTHTCTFMRYHEYTTHWEGYFMREWSFDELHSINFMLDYIKRDKLTSQVGF